MESIRIRGGGYSEHSTKPNGGGSDSGSGDNYEPPTPVGETYDVKSPTKTINIKANGGVVKKVYTRTDTYQDYSDGSSRLIRSKEDSIPLMIIVKEGENYKFSEGDTIPSSK